MKHRLFVFTGSKCPHCKNVDENIAIIYHKFTNKITITKKVDNGILSDNGKNYKIGYTPVYVLLPPEGIDYEVNESMFYRMSLSYNANDNVFGAVPNSSKDRVELTEWISNILSNDSIVINEPRNHSYYEVSRYTIVQATRGRI